MKLIFSMLSCLILGSSHLFGQSLPATAADVRPLPVGAPVPDISVTAVTGETVGMKSLLGGKPTVLVFYRGGWCPYCNRQLADLAVVEKDLKAMGYQVVAVSPDAPEQLRASGEKWDLGYRLYSDAPGKLIRAMGLAFAVPENYRGIIRDASGGLNMDVLPVPAVFLLDGQGKITYVYFNPDFRERLSGEKLLAEAKAFRGKP
ncbi:peroxiredoxin-like family protein [Chitinophaga rhizosphaerae]|uniref:peroxiredoxin-like family protein n=1 Tax=Chitinophaga rhizosphaerae TaxID=1864947 RepID=UPI0013E00088|nr:peroxiredoxin-like family protein [Chitinophaga rhizosphaerae]